MTKSSSGFSCHLMKTFNGCTDKQAAKSLAQVFTFHKDQLNNTINRSTRADANVPIFLSENVGHPVTSAAETVDAAGCITYIFVYVSAVITLTIQSH